MTKINFKGNIGVEESVYHIGISLVEFKENEVVIIYSPALDLSGYGNTANEAKESFKIALEEFLRYTLNENTFNEVLQELGWTIKSEKPLQIEPPLNSDLIGRNQLFNEIVNSKSYKVYKEEVEIAF